MAMKQDRSSRNVHYDHNIKARRKLIEQLKHNFTRKLRRPLSR